MSNDDRMILKVLSRLNEAEARVYVAKEAICKGRGGVQRMRELTGLSRVTILKGISELRQQEQEPVRQSGGGREGSEESTPNSTGTTRSAVKPYGVETSRI